MLLHLRHSLTAHHLLLTLWSGHHIRLLLHLRHSLTAHHLLLALWSGHHVRLLLHLRHLLHLWHSLATHGGSVHHLLATTHIRRLALPRHLLHLRHCLAAHHHLLLATTLATVGCTTHISRLRLGWSVGILCLHIRLRLFAHCHLLLPCLHSLRLSLGLCLGLSLRLRLRLRLRLGLHCRLLLLLLNHSSLLSLHLFPHCFFLLPSHFLLLLLDAGLLFLLLLLLLFLELHNELLNLGERVRSQPFQHFDRILNLLGRGSRERRCHGYPHGHHGRCRSGHADTID